MDCGPQVVKPVEGGMMDRFWIFLEALAGFFENGQAIEALKHDLRQMPAAERERTLNYLRTVSEKIPHLSSEHHEPITAAIEQGP